ncbi:MAG: transrane sulfatase [Stenotrophomonas indicatrix]|jgi:arylsulfatase A-like enzyme|uniref:LTA synthase family protein n=1 Tax=Stenotrophomonas indicatrix TaxID=2045451 RepID=UPI0010C3E292|nr:LTA synthase family protein [Stenotrophomonas indicatrix]MDF2481238.1 transrane sulfatase [Stenotrophomonas indicatrix]QBR43042.1 sulfatase [Stenotrophomonas indicatrix]
MSINILNISRRFPAWGTCVAALLTGVLLLRMSRYYAPADLLYLSTSFLLELVLIDLVTHLALGVRNRLLRVLALAFPATAGIVYVAQLYSAWLSGGLIPPIAFANQEVAGLIAFNGVYAMLGAYLLAFISFAIIHRADQPRFSLRISLACLAVAATAYTGMVHDQPPARGIVVARGEAPVTSFLRAYSIFAGMNGRAQLTATELLEARAEFSRKKIYQQGFPAEITASLPAKPNVIVIFTEGMSARWMDTYDSAHAGVTPNLDRLAGGSLVVSNYYNHTAATFRGLRGQLTSGHQEIDGYNAEGTGIGQRDVSADVTAISRASIADVLRAQGYNSMFFLSQQEYINKMIETLGFDRVLGRDYLYETHVRKGAQEARPKYLSDTQLFDSMLSELEAQPADKPFFAAAYNFQTHAFLDGESRYGKGDNIVLNRFHTYDRDIGHFIERFMASRLHENTMLVITADHSTFPGPNAVAADSRVQGYFVDKIPFLIYWKGVEHRTIDAAGKNSLDLAPSLLSLLNVQDAHNLFLGCTIFEQCALDRVSNIGIEYILTDAKGSYSEYYVPAEQKAHYEQSRDTIERYKSMDLIIDTR